MLKCIIVSDVHLGLKHSKAKELVDFLIKNPTEMLILNGDIIDDWAVRKFNNVSLKHIVNYGLYSLEPMGFLKYIHSLIPDTKIIWCYGNHDESMKELAGKKINGVDVVEDYIINIDSKRYLVFHGQQIDIFHTKYKWISRTGAVLYELLVSLNRFINRLGIKTDFSRTIKEHSKKTTNSGFIRDACHLAIANGFDGVICGHTHIPKDIQWMTNGKIIRYLNSGDWLENESCIIVNQNNRIELKK